MDHIAQFRVLTLSDPLLTSSDSHIHVSILQFQTLHMGCLTQRHMPKRGQIIETLFRR